MGDDNSVLHWIATAALAIAAFFSKRALNQQDQAIEQHGRAIADIRVDIAKNYPTKDEVERGVKNAVAPLQADIQEMKRDIKTLIGRGTP